ncbi:universal stress protein [Nonomuraea jabiensis]|uniref:universal stress protein n=1 Tax=Nonomuraea jabiensis TaxID=882448 RepID=UPI003448D9AE
MNRAVVVGVDGSRTAWSALAWAAGDAARRGLPLRIVHVREPWLAEHPLGASGETLTERCDRLLTGAADRAHELAPGARISTALVTGAVIERLRWLLIRRNVTTGEPAFLAALAALQPVCDEEHIPLIVPEIRRLLAVPILIRYPTIRQILYWSQWRRRHQVTARRCHHQCRSQP